MPDLQPDTSIYANVGKGTMKPVDLLRLIAGIKEFQSRQNMTGAIQNAPQIQGPLGSTIDYGAARKSWQSNPTGGFLDPADAADLERAQQTQFVSQQMKVDAIGKAIQPVLDLGPKASARDFARISAPVLAGLGIPPDAIDNIVSGPRSGPEFIRNLQMLKNMYTGGVEPMVTVPGAGGAPMQQPAGAAAMQARGVGGTGYPGLPTSGGPAEAPYWADVATAGNYQRDVLPLVQAIPALARLGKRGLGPGTDELNNIKAFLITTGADKMLGIDAEKVKDYTEAKKYLVDWSNRVSAGGTNDRLAAAFESNPNMKMTQAAAINVAKTALAVRSMQQAKTLEFQKTGLPPNQYASWASWWDQQQDPRAFGMAMMNKKAVQTMLKGMSPAERARFEASEKIASQYPVTGPSGGWNIPEDEGVPTKPKAQPQAAAEAGGNL